MIISRIQVLNYGCLRYVDVPLDRFHVLIGPNASGKSTLMDAIKFVSDVVNDGVGHACRSRTSNFADLVWGRPESTEDQRFEIALEFDLPEKVKTLMPEERPFSVFRYEMSVGVDPQSGHVGLSEERGALLVKRPSEPRQLTMFPESVLPESTILSRTGHHRRSVFSKSKSGQTRYYYETSTRSGRGGWVTGLNLGSDRSAMSILPDNDSNYPALTETLVFLRDKVVTLSLNSERMRQASPPGSGDDFLPDGSNTPWVADTLFEHYQDRSDGWIGHLQDALRGFDSVRVVDRPDDRHKYLMLKYGNGLEVPSWKASDGTLRLLALTMLAYLPEPTGLYMIEEPENGINPGALESVFNSLSSVYDAQVLLATHSPEFVAIADVKDLLCFGKTEEGVVDIVPGRSHPRLRDWQHQVDLGTFFASGILA